MTTPERHVYIRFGNGTLRKRKVTSSLRGARQKAKIDPFDEHVLLLWIIIRL